MRNTLFTCFWLLITLPSLGQGAGQMYNKAKAYSTDGKHGDALKQCIELLRIKSSHKKAQALFETSYRAVESLTESEVMNLELEAEDQNGIQKTNTHKTIAGYYKNLVNLRKECKSLPPITNKNTKQPLYFGNNDFMEEWKQSMRDLKAAKSEGAAFHYQKGLELEKTMSDNKDLARKAAIQFRLAGENLTGYEDSDSKYANARALAIKRLAVIPFDNKSGRADFGAIEELITDRYIATMIKDEGAMEFIEMVTRDQLETLLAEQRLNMSSLLDESTVVERGKLLGVEMLITGKINQLSYDKTPTVQSTYNDEKRVKTGTEKYVDSKGKVRSRFTYGQVRAQVNKYRKEASARINGSYKMIDVKTGQVLSSEAFTEKVDWSHDWGNYRGDERALSSESYTLCSQTEAFPPSPTEMTSQVADRMAYKLSRDIGRKLKNP